MKCRDGKQPNENHDKCVDPPTPAPTYNPTQTPTEVPTESPTLSCIENESEFLQALADSQGLDEQAIRFVCAGAQIDLTKTVVIPNTANIKYQCLSGECKIIPVFTGTVFTHSGSPTRTFKVWFEGVSFLNGSGRVSSQHDFMRVGGEAGAMITFSAGENSPCVFRNNSVRTVHHFSSPTAPSSIFLT